MADIEQQAKLVLLGAKARAERLLQVAQGEAEELKKAAHAQALAEGRAEGLARGLEEGRKQGREQALAERRQELAELAGALAAGATELDVARVELGVQARQAVVDLAVAIAERVTKRMGALDPAVALANIDEALRLVVHGADVRIAVHPAQRAAIAEVLPRVQAAWPALAHVELIADGTLAPGGCRVYAGGGCVDADLQLQLDKIAAELVPARDGEEA